MLHPAIQDNTRLKDVQETATQITNEIDGMALTTNRIHDPVEDYTILTIDRSSSMVNEPIAAIENATVALGLALEELGSNVCLTDVYHGEPRIISPFGESITDAIDDVFTGEVLGSTPHGDLLQKIRVESDCFDNHGIISANTSLIAVTDGLPDNNEKFNCEINKWGISATAIIPNTNQANLSHTLGKVTELYDDYTVAHHTGEFSPLLKQAYIKQTLFEN